MLQLQKLAQIAQKKKRTIVGLMSGTSLDGLDIALCELTGTGIDTQLKLTAFTTVTYESAFVTELKQVFSQKRVDLEKVCLLNAYIGSLHGDLVNQQLSEWQVEHSEVDLIASHGQTIYHAPLSQHKHQYYPNATLQIGDGDHVSKRTGIITIADFRQRQIAAGGEGAPLVTYGDVLLFTADHEDRILINIGGISNFTYLPISNKGEIPFSSDIGPGNKLMDEYVQSHFKSMQFDSEGHLAKQGKIIDQLLSQLKDHSFFNEPLPKTTGVEVFNLDYVNRAIKRLNVSQLSPHDVLATLNQFSADIIYNCIKPLIEKEPNTAIYLSGGGVNNPILLNAIKAYFPNHPVKTTDAIGMNPDAKEACLFALLANETIAGNRLSTQKLMGMPNTSMGKICLPD